MVRPGMRMSPRAQQDLFRHKCLKLRGCFGGRQPDAPRPVAGRGAAAHDGHQVGQRACGTRNSCRASSSGRNPESSAIAPAVNPMRPISPGPEAVRGTSSRTEVNSSSKPSRRAPAIVTSSNLPCGKARAGTSERGCSRACSSARVAASSAPASTCVSGACEKPWAPISMPALASVRRSSLDHAARLADEVDLGEQALALLARDRFERGDRDPHRPEWIAVHGDGRAPGSAHEVADPRCVEPAAPPRCDQLLLPERSAAIDRITGDEHRRRHARRAQERERELDVVAPAVVERDQQRPLGQPAPATSRLEHVGERDDVIMALEERQARREHVERQRVLRVARREPRVAAREHAMEIDHGEPIAIAPAVPRIEDTRHVRPALHPR